MLLKRKECDELGAVSHGQTAFWYNSLTWLGQPPEARLALRRHVVCSWGWGVPVVCIKAYIYMTRVTHFSLLHIV